MRAVLAVMTTIGLMITGVPPATAAAKTSLTITADLADGAASYKWTLACDPIGGKHPNRKPACALLAKAGTSIFAPVPADAACTAIYGGPERVKVVGSVRGKRVNAIFVRNDGCQIARFDRASALFTIPKTVVIRGAVTLDDQPADGTVIFMNDARQVVTRSVAGAFAVRLGFGTWLGAASAGARSCIPIVVTVPGELPAAPIIACRTTASG